MLRRRVLGLAYTRDIALLPPTHSPLGFISEQNDGTRPHGRGVPRFVTTKTSTTSPLTRCVEGLKGLPNILWGYARKSSHSLRFERDRATVGKELQREVDAMGMGTSPHERNHRHELYEMR